MEYKSLTITFLPHDKPEIEARVREGCKFLETMINSQMFKDMVLEGNYVETLSNEGIYEKYMNSHFTMVFKITEAPHMNVGFSVNQDTDIVSVYANNLKYDIPTMAAVLSHEYGHIINFDHKVKWAQTFSFYLQNQGGKVFRKFYKKLKGKQYPRKGKWLVYEPIVFFLWFWKVLRWK